MEEERLSQIFVKRSLMDRAMHSEGLTKDQLLQLDKSTLLRAAEIEKGEKELDKKLAESPRLKKYLENRKNSTKAK